MAIALMTLMLDFLEVKVQRAAEMVGFVTLLVAWLLRQYCANATRSSCPQ
jgi:hypothetical protein